MRLSAVEVEEERTGAAGSAETEDCDDDDD